MSETIRGIPETISKQEGIRKNVPIFEFQKQKKPVRTNAEIDAELESISAFRKRIIDALNPQPPENHPREEQKPLTMFQLTTLLLLAFCGRALYGSNINNPDEELMDG